MLPPLSALADSSITEFPRNGFPAGGAVDADQSTKLGVFVRQKSVAGVARDGRHCENAEFGDCGGSEFCGGKRILCCEFSTASQKAVWIGRWSVAGTGEQSEKRKGDCEFGLKGRRWESRKE
jgi:hypothetical protein